MPMSPRHWLFAYGSLINADSRALSFACQQARVARAHGFRRGWFHTAHEQPLSGVVATPDEGVTHAINGMLVQLAEDQLALADARELPFGYVRQRLAAESLALEEGGLSPADRVWVYVVPRVDDRRTSVIYQSYLDVILAGCLAVGEDFAREFVRTTTLWSAAWIDDRARPRYARAMAPGPVQARIDVLLRETLPAAFAARACLEEPAPDPF
jgi:gamma-glutamylcyclotransferase (GGCT)/AIG2-like uncharacterized protein YtfP